MANTKIVRGSDSSPTFYESRQWNKATGESRSYRRVFSGVTAGSDLDAYNAAMAEFAALKASRLYDSLNVEPDADNARWILSGTQAETAYSTTPGEGGCVIELVGQESQKDSRLSLVFQSQITKSKASQIVAIADALKQAAPADYETAYNSAVGYVTAVAAQAGVGSSANCLQFFDDWAAGMDSYKFSAITFRKTVTAAVDVYIPVDYSNANKIFTTAELRTAESIPNEYLLPTGYWLKKYPTNSVAFGQKQQWLFEYEFSDRAIAEINLYYANKS
jgi:hypothetical protein